MSQILLASLAFRAITSPHTFVYDSDGDANGVAYFLGTNLGAIPWENPHTAGRCVCQASSLQAGTVTLFVDRAPPDFSDSGTDNIANSWISIDLGSSRTLVPTDYTLRNRAFDGTRPVRNWKLQGSNDSAGNSVAQLAAATWADIDIRIADTTMAAVANEFATYASNQSNSTPYRWLRIFQNGTNGNGDNFLLISEFEFYGTFVF